MFGTLSRWLDRTAFPRIEDTHAEADKVAALRVATGLILSWRCALMLRDSLFYFDPVPWLGMTVPLHALAAAVQLALSVGLALGVRPAICALVLMATHAAYSIWTGTYNLSPMLLVPMLGAFAALETGRRSLLAKPSLPPEKAVYRTVYLILFLVYAGLSLQACLYHVDDEYWIRGYTPAVLLTNSYLSEFYASFRALESAAPDVFRWSSAAVVLLQTVFQLAMVPLLASRIGTRFTAVWGWIFILVSLVDLQLSVLPLVEVVLWAMVFVPGRSFAWIHRKSVKGAAALPPGKLQAGWQILFAAGFGLMLLSYFGNAISGFATGHRLPGRYESTVLFYAGLVAPNVFNREDLTMGDRWVVIERLDGPSAGVVPLNGTEGERLAYHRSDLLYFGNSLPWRRAMIDLPDLHAYHQPGAGGHAYAHLAARYDYRRHGAAGPGLYRCTLYRNQAANFALGTDPARYLPEIVLTFDLQIGAAGKSP